MKASNRFISAALAAGVALAFAASAWAVKPPSEKERAENSRDKHEWSDLKPGRKGYTKGGRFCECGVSATNENECYVPRAGQLCCNPKTGECRMLEMGKVNTPW
ncbi:MAG: hypothetical protein JXA24_05265 [Proteobacteria bacterium]|nr:hypothetical protein [Pseudomonadota bacterium]